MLLPYRDEPRDPDHTPWVTWSLVLANLVVFGLTSWRRPDEDLVDLWDRWGFSPERASATTLLTSMFLHGDGLHLIGNMLVLWVLGPNVERGLGRPLFLAGYLAGGAAGHALYGAFDTVGRTSIGASGAISAVGGAYLVAFPRHRVRVFLVLFVSVAVFSLPAWVLLGAWLVFDLLPILRGEALDQVNRWAHVGGVAFGALMMLGTIAWLRRSQAQASRPAKAGSWERWLDAAKAKAPSGGRRP